jgi:hypothetical protein
LWIEGTPVSDTRAVLPLGRDRLDSVDSSTVSRVPRLFESTAKYATPKCRINTPLYPPRILEGES